MRVLMVEPGKSPRIEEIVHTLESMQNAVGGYIECVCPWNDNAVLVCNEEGVLLGLEYNREAAPGLHILGSFFVCGVDGEDFTDLTQDQAEKYAELLRIERGVRVENGGDT